MASVKAVIRNPFRYVLMDVTEEESSEPVAPDDAFQRTSGTPPPAEPEPTVSDREVRVTSISDAPRVALTERQRQVLRLVRAGATDRQIAARVRTSTRTVQREIARIRAALGAPSRTAIIASAVRAGNTELSGPLPPVDP